MITEKLPNAYDIVRLPAISARSTYRERPVSEVNRPSIASVRAASNSARGGGGPQEPDRTHDRPLHVDPPV